MNLEIVCINLTQNLSAILLSVNEIRFYNLVYHFHSRIELKKTLGPRNFYLFFFFFDFDWFECQQHFYTLLVKGLRNLRYSRKNTAVDEITQNAFTFCTFSIYRRISCVYNWFLNYVLFKFCYISIIKEKLSVKYCSHKISAKSVEWSKQLSKFSSKAKDFLLDRKSQNIMRGRDFTGGWGLKTLLITISWDKSRPSKNRPEHFRFLIHS